MPKKNGKNGNGGMAVAEAPVSGEIEEPLSPGEARHLGKLERVIEKGLQTFREVGMALLEIRESRLYRMTHGNFADYCLDRWKITGSRAYQIIDAAEVAEQLGGDAPVNEAQAAELVRVMRTDPKLVKKVWRQVKAQAAETGHAITAEVIREKARDVLTPNATSDVSDTERLVAGILRIARQYEAWDASKPTRKERAIVRGALDKFSELTGG